MSEVKHSPLPWAVLESWPHKIVAAKDAARGIGWHIDHKMDRLLYVNVLVDCTHSDSKREWRNIPIETAKANAALICKAVNNHDKLVALVKRMDELIEERPAMKDYVPLEYINETRALLAEIERA